MLRWMVLSTHTLKDIEGNFAFITSLKENLPRAAWSKEKTNPFFVVEDKLIIVSRHIHFISSSDITTRPNGD